MDVKPLNPPAPARGNPAPSADGRPAVAATAPQPFVYPLEREFREPDWTRIPGYRSLSADDAEKLLARHLNRVTDTCIPEEEALRRLEKTVLEAWVAADRKGAA